MFRFSLVILLALKALTAQNPYGRIRGRVADATGAAIPSAGVRVVNVATNVAAATASNSEGNYEAVNLIPGQYQVEVEMAGFKKYRRGPIELRVGDVLAVDVQLEVGDVADSITVSAEAPLLEASNAALGQLVDHRRIIDLPISGGNAMYLVQMAPGVVSTNPPTHGWLPQANDVGSNVAVMGTRTRSSEFQLDGIPNMTGDGRFSFSPPPEMIQEFRVQTAAYDASIGRFTGAQINMTLKSGTNQPHGNLYFTHTSRPLMARDFFTNRFIYDTRTGPITEEKKKAAWPPVLTNRYRASASGPLYIPKVYDGRNRTFWTYGFDMFDRNRPEQAYFTVPTVRQRAGDFSELLALGSTYQIYDPATIAAAPNGRFSRRPFAGNVIPASRLDATARRVLEYYSLPNVPGSADGRNNYSDPQPRLIDYHSHTSRVDQSIGDRHRMFGSLTWSFADGISNRSFHNEARGQSEARQHRGLSVSDVATLRPNLIVDLRYGVTRFLTYNRPVSIGFDLSKLGLPSALINRLDSRITSFPEINIDGYTSVGRNSGFRNATTYHSLAGITSYIRGNHSFRFGGEWRILQENNLNYGTVSPRMDFSTLWTRGPLDNAAAAPIGQGLASFLLGLPTAGYIDRNAMPAEQSYYLGGFLQDDWKLARTFTLNIGIRYELELPNTERFNRVNRGFDFNTPNPVEERARANYARSPIAEIPVAQFRATGGLMFAGLGGLPRTQYSADRNNFAPRIGFAWTATPSLVVRAGYGFFFQPIGADRLDVLQQGFSQRTELVPSLDNGLTFRGTLGNPFPDGILEPVGAAGGLTTFLGRDASFFPVDRRAPFMQRWSLGVQRELGHRMLAGLNYAGSRGHGLGVSEDLNALPVQYLSKSPVRDQAAIDYLTQQVANPFSGLPEFTGTSLASRTVPRSQLLRPFPHFTSLGATYGRGRSWYHSLQTHLQKRFSHGYTLQAGWTWSKFLEQVERLNAGDAQLHRVVSPQDRPHHITLSGIWDLPFGKGRRWAGSSRLLEHAAGGWTLTALWQWQSGPPVNWGNILFYGGIQDMVIPYADRTVERWFNTEAGFEKDARRQLASNQRTFPLRLTGVRADGFNNWDMSIYKNIRFGEKVTLQLRAEAQDALNHAMFAAPNAVPTNTLFGQVTTIQATEQRRIALGGRLSW